MPAPRVDFQVRSQKAKAGIDAIRRELRQLRDDATGTQRALSGLRVQRPRGAGARGAADDMSRLSREAREAAKALDRAGDEARSFDRRARGSRRQANGLVTEFLAFGSAVRALEGPLGGTAARLQTVGAVMKQGQFAAVALAGAVAGTVFAFGLFSREAIQARLEMDRIVNSLRAATGSFAGARRELGFVREEVDRLGLDLRTSAQQFASLSAAARGSSLAGDEVRRIFTAVGTAATALGLSTADASGALRAIQQIISKGTVQAEELRGQLGERIPGAFQQAARGMGVTTTQLNDMLERGEVLASDLLPKMATELLETFGPTAQQAAKGLRAEINRATTSIFESTVELDKALGVSEAWKAIVGATASTLDTLSNRLQGVSAAQEGANKQTERAVELRQRQEELAGTAAARLAAREQERLVQERFEAAQERLRDFLRAEEARRETIRPQISEGVVRGEFPREDVTAQRRFIERQFPTDRAREFAREVVSIAEAAQGIELFDPTQQALVANMVDEMRRLRREGGSVQDVFARITGMANRAVTNQSRLGDETERVVRNLQTLGRTTTEVFDPELPRDVGRVVERLFEDVRQASVALTEEQRRENEILFRSRRLVGKLADDELADLFQVLRNNEVQIKRTGDGLRKDLIETIKFFITVAEQGRQSALGLRDTLIEAGTGAATTNLEIGQQIKNLREQAAAFEESAREGRIVTKMQQVLSRESDLSVEQARALATTWVDARDRLAEAQDVTRDLRFDLEKLRRQTIEAGTGAETFASQAENLEERFGGLSDAAQRLRRGVAVTAGGVGFIGGLPGGRPFTAAIREGESNVEAIRRQIGNLREQVDAFERSGVQGRITEATQRLTEQFDLAPEKARAFAVEIVNLRRRLEGLEDPLQEAAERARALRRELPVTAGGRGFIGPVGPESPLAEAEEQRRQESERADEAVRESIRGLRDETTVLRLRVAGEARLADLTERRLALERQIGRELGPGEIEQLRREIGAQRALNRELEAQQELTRLAERGFDRVGESITEAFVRGEASMVSFRNVALGIISEVTQTLVQFAAINPLKNALVPGRPFPTFGDFGGGGGGIVGGLDVLSILTGGLGSIFGGPSALQLSGPFSHGGSFRVGSQFPRIDAAGGDNRLVALTARDQERVTVTPPAASPGGEVVIAEQSLRSLAREVAHETARSMGPRQQRDRDFGPTERQTSRR